MKKKILIITGLVVLISVLIVARITSQRQESQKGLEIVSVEPTEDSKVWASTKKLNVIIVFSKEIGNSYDNLMLIDNVGLNWDKNLTGVNTVEFSASFGKEIMSVPQLKIELLMGETLLKSWSYEVPIDEKLAGEYGEIEVEEGASFIPDTADIEYFSKVDEQINKDQPLWKLLPYETDKFKINHYIEPLKLVVYLKSEAVQKEVEIEVKAWIKDNGGDEKVHKLEFRN